MNHDPFATTEAQDREDLDVLQGLLRRRLRELAELLRDERAVRHRLQQHARSPRGIRA